MPDGNIFTPRGQQQIDFLLKEGHHLSLFSKIINCANHYIYVLIDTEGYFELLLVSDVLINAFFPSLNKYMKGGNRAS